MSGAATAEDNTTGNTPPADDQKTLGGAPQDGGGAEPNQDGGGADAAGQDQQDPGKTAPKMIPVDRMVAELTPLRNRQRELEHALREATDIIKQLQGGKGQQGQGQQGQGDNREPPARQPEPATDVIEAKALELDRQRNAQRIDGRGREAYGSQDWESACSLMGALGLNNLDFVATVSDIAGSDHTHAVFHAIANDPERAQRIAKMPIARRIVEIGKIADTVTDPSKQTPQPTPTNTQQQQRAPARRVSQAPDPAPRAQTGTRGPEKPWYSDDVTDEEFSRGFEEHMAKRAQRGRR